PLLEDELRQDLVTAGDFPFMGPSPEAVARIMAAQREEERKKAEEALRAAQEAARAQAEMIRLFERGRELSQLTGDDFRAILATEREIVRALQSGNASLAARVRLAENLARIHQNQSEEHTSELQ